MSREPDDDCATLGHELLMMFERALRERRSSVAEHLRCALEELVRSEPVCRATLNQAYLLIGRPGRVKA